MTDGWYGYKSSALGMVGEPLLCGLHAQCWGETQILKVCTRSLCLQLASLLSQMNSDMNALGGWRHRDTLSQNGVQTITNTNVYTSNVEVIAALFDH